MKIVYKLGGFSTLVQHMLHMIVVKEIHENTRKMISAIFYLDSNCVSSSSVHEAPKFATKRVEHGGLLPGAGGGGGTMP